MQQNVFENVASTMASISSRSECVKAFTDVVRPRSDHIYVKYQLPLYCEIFLYIILIPNIIWHIYPLYLVIAPGIQLSQVKPPVNLYRTAVSTMTVEADGLALSSYQG